MLILPGSRRFWARPSFHGTMEWGTGAQADAPKKMSRKFDALFRCRVSASRRGLATVCHRRTQSGAARQAVFKDKRRKPCKAPSLPLSRLCCPARSPPASLFFPGILSNWLQATAAQGRLAGSQALEGLPAETWQLGVIDWWSTSTDRIGQPFCHRPTTVHLIKREGRTKTGQCNIPLSTARLFLRKVDKAYHNRDILQVYRTRHCMSRVRVPTSSPPTYLPSPTTKVSRQQTEHVRTSNHYYATKTSVNDMNLIRRYYPIKWFYIVFIKEFNRSIY